MVRNYGRHDALASSACVFVLTSLKRVPEFLVGLCHQLVAFQLLFALLVPPLLQLVMQAFSLQGLVLGQACLLQLELGFAELLQTKFGESLSVFELAGQAEFATLLESAFLEELLRCTRAEASL